MRVGQLKKDTIAFKCVRFLALLLPALFFVSYRPGELIVLLASPPANASSTGRLMDPLDWNYYRAFGENPALSVLGLCVVSFGYGCFYASSRTLRLGNLLVCSIVAIACLSIPVIIIRSRQVAEQWGFGSLFPGSALSTSEYVSIQNACALLCGSALVLLVTFGTRIGPSGDLTHYSRSENRFSKE